MYAKSVLHKKGMQNNATSCFYFILYLFDTNVWMTLKLNQIFSQKKKQIQALKNIGKGTLKALPYVILREASLLAEDMATMRKSAVSTFTDSLPNRRSYHRV